MVLCLALAAGAKEARARSIYVSLTGRDTSPGTLAQPLSNPHRALELARPGDTIYLRQGRYNLTKSLWVDRAGVTISSYPGESAAFVAPSGDEKSLTSVIVIVASNVSLVGLEIQGGSYYGVKVDVDKERSTTGVTIRSCRIHDTGRDCVKTFNADRLLIEGCEIGPSGVRDPSDAEGIDSIGSVGVTIRRCYIHDSTTNGLYLKGGARDGVVEGCRIENTGDFGGILLGQDTDLERMRDGVRYEAINCIARNNIVSHTGAAGLATYSGYDIRFENNTLYDVARRLQAGFWVVTNGRNVRSERVTFKNNIVVMSSGRPFVFLKDLGDRLDSDSNIYYSAAGACAFVREMTGGREQSNRWSFAQWKRALASDAHSQVVDPMLDTSDLYRPLGTSPAIDRGETLLEVKNDYSGTARPQGPAYDVGAHERVARDRAATGAPAAVRPLRFPDWITFIRITAQVSSILLASQAEITRG